MMEAPARFVDGETAEVRQVTLLLDEGDGIILVRQGDRIVARWPLGDVRLADSPIKDRLPRLRCGEARATVQDPSFIDGLRWHTRDLHKRDPVPGQLRKMAVWALGAVASVAVIVLVIVPALANRLAPLVPIDREAKLAEAALDQLSLFLGMPQGAALYCSSPEGDAALAKMAARLASQFETDYDIKVQIVNDDMVNAFALPGGNILLFDGLLQAADAPEEVAGVLGHEMGHVVNRDPTRLALRSAGTVGVLGLLLGDFSGGSVVLLLGSQVLQASYSQEAETLADSFAIEVMGDTGLPSSALGTMFDRFAAHGGETDAEEDGLLSHLASHPDTQARADAARAGDVVKDAGFDPVLSGPEWAALKSICTST